MKVSSILCAAGLAFPLFVVSCGGSDTNGFTSGSGVGGSGTAAGGAATANTGGGNQVGSTGGNNSAAGGNATPGSGGNSASTGGNANNPNAGGAGNAAGSTSTNSGGAGNMAGAPNTPPTGTCPNAPMGACTLADVGLVCPGAQNRLCSCTPMQGGFLAWQCNQVSQACPATAPTPASACVGDAQCTYASSRCACIANAWQCDSCPATEPPSQSMCPRNLRGQACAYGQAVCICVQPQQQQQQQSTTQWACITPLPPQPANCPQGRPQVGMTCQDGVTVGLACTYASDSGPQLCTCLQNGNNKQWGCIPAPVN